MQAVVADESLTVVFRSAADQTGQIFHPHVVFVFVWPLNQEQVDMVRAISFFTHMQWHKATLITKA